jgi:vitamin B12 transporter
MVPVGLSLLSMGLHADSRAQQFPDTTRLDPVVVTAERLPTARAATPATVTVVTGEELTARGIRHIAEALRDVAGIDVAQTGSYGGNTALFLRGGESDYVKVLVDGVPINDPGGAIDFADLTTDNVDRIEIVRGPASVLYGSDAVSGVVQVFTRRGAGPTHGEASVRVGSHAAFEALGGIAGGTDAVSYSVTATRASTAGIYAFNNEYRNVGWSGLLRAAPDAETSASLSLRYLESRYHYPTDGTGAVEDENALQRRDRVAAALEVGRYIAPDVEVRLLLALNQVDGGIDDRPDGPADTLGFYGYNSVQAVSRRSADLRVNAYAAQSSVLTAGVQLEEQRERSQSESESEYGPSTSAFDAGRVNVGYYLQLHAAPGSSVSFTVGARLDDNDVFGTFISYRGGVAVRLPTGTRLRGSIGRAFKEPTFFESFADAPFARGNPALRPERVASWEVGVEQHFLSESLAVGATYFHQRFRDLIQYTFAPPGPTDPTYYNIANASARGVELEVQADLEFGLAVRGGYTYLETEVIDAGFDVGAGAAFVTGQRLLRRPTHSVSVVVSQRFSRRASVAGTVRYVGSRDDRDFAAFPTAPVVLPSVVTIDLSANVTVWSADAGRPAVDLTARIANLFDEQYQEVFGFRTPGRALLFGVRAEM